jgi:hypothetical protein
MLLGLRPYISRLDLPGQLDLYVGVAHHAWWQHQRQTSPERGQVLAAQPAGQRDLGRREDGLGVHQRFDRAGLGDRGLGAEGDDGAVESPGTEGDDDEGAYRHPVSEFVREVVGEGWPDCA